MADTSPKDTFDELKTLVTDYARQETGDRIKRVGQWLGFGFAGGVFLAIGGFLLSLGTLRLLQEWDATDGKWGSLLPYAFTLLLLGLLIVMCVIGLTRRPDWLKEDA